MSSLARQIEFSPPIRELGKHWVLHSKGLLIATIFDLCPQGKCLRFRARAFTRKSFKGFGIEIANLNWGDAVNFNTVPEDPRA